MSFSKHHESKHASANAQRIIKLLSHKEIPLSTPFRGSARHGRDLRLPLHSLRCRQRSNLEGIRSRAPDQCTVTTILMRSRRLSRSINLSHAAQTRREEVIVHGALHLVTAPGEIRVRSNERGPMVFLGEVCPHRFRDAANANNFSLGIYTVLRGLRFAVEQRRRRGLDGRDGRGEFGEMGWVTRGEVRDRLDGGAPAAVDELGYGRCGGVAGGSVRKVEHGGA